MIWHEARDVVETDWRDETFGETAAPCKGLWSCVQTLLVARKRHLVRTLDQGVLCPFGRRPTASR